VDFHISISALLWGLAGAIPLYGLFVLSERLPATGFQQIKRFLIDYLGPFLDTCRWTGLFYLALLAGITEEILFRGLLQALFELHWGWLVGIIASNILFALAHSITPLYVLLAGLTGIYLGFSLDFGGERNLLTPITIHAFYDFLAFLAVARAYRQEQRPLDLL
jgi:hypothetical protein